MSDAPCIARLYRVCLEVDGEDRNGRSRSSRGSEGRRADGHKHVDVAPHEIVSQSRERLRLTARKTDFEGHVLPLYVADLAQASAERLNADGGGTKVLVQYADDRDASGSHGLPDERHSREP